MENKFMRFLSLLLAFVMVIGMVPVSQAQAVEGETEYVSVEVIPRYNSNRLTWTVESGVTCNVECSTDGGATFTTVATAEADGEYIHENVGVGTQYQYRLAMSNGSYSQTVQGAVTGMEALKATAVKYVDYGAEGKVFTNGLNPNGEMEIFAEDDDVDKLNALTNGTILYKANYEKFTSGGGETMAAVLGAKTASGVAFLYVGSVDSGKAYRVALNNALSSNDNQSGAPTPAANKDVAFAVTYDNATGLFASAANGAAHFYYRRDNLKNKGLLTKRNATEYYVGCTLENNGRWKNFNGTVYYVIVTPEVLSDAELLAVTKVNNVTGVTLSETALKLDVEGTAKLTANVTAEAEGDFNQKVFWASSNESVATVDSNGNVTAVGAGDATITVTTADMHLTATCDVHVHNWGEWKPVAAATCSSKGSEKRVCEYNESHVETRETEKNANAHTYGDLISAQPAEHTPTVLKAGVDAHYLCACGQYFTEGKEKTTLEALTGTVPTHDFSDNARVCRVCGIANKDYVPVAKIGEQGYDSFAEALAAASAMTGDVTVEIYDKVILNQPLTGSYSSIKFVGKNIDAEIYLDVQGYTTATGKKVAFEALTLSKSAGGHIANAGFMNVAFGIYDVIEVTYTNCTFANGAYASSGKVVFDGCTFKRSHDKYGLWAYGDADVTVDGCTFADYRGIKMYDEGRAGIAELTVKNTDFSAVTDKPAIVLTYGESVTLEGNTYSGTGTFELDLDGAPNGTAVTSDVAPICKNDNGACGVLVDGKIYTTVAQAAAAAVENSEVTVLYSTEETAEFPKGTDLSLAENVAAPNVTVKQPVYVAQVGEAKYERVIEALQAAANIESNETVVVELLSDVREVMPTDIELRLKSDVKIVSGNAAARAVAGPVAAKFYNNGTNFDFIFNSATGFEGKTLTIGENVTFELEDRIIWAGYHGNNIDVVVNGTLAGSQYWNGADTTVNAGGKLITTGEALVLRRGADLTVNGGEVNANYFSMLSGNLIATNDATVNCGPVWINNTASYAGEGNVTITVENSTLTSNGNLTSYTTHADGVKINIQNSNVQFKETDHKGCVLDANSTIIIGAGSDLGLKTLTGTGSIEIDVTGMTEGEIESISGNLSGFTGNIDVTNIPEGLEAKRDENGNVVLVAKPVVAVINGINYTSLADAVAAANAGDEIVMLADVTEDVTVPAGVIFNGNGKQVGVITAAGEITFKGVTKAANFGTEYTNTTINIPAGACLEITGTGRLVIGHGCTFNITGTIENAKTANVADLTPSLIAPGASFTGAGVNFNVTNAYIKFTAYCSSKNSNASGTFNFNINNSVWEQSGSLVFSEPTNGKDPTVNFSLTDSVLNSTSHLVFAVTKGEVVIDNSNVNVGTSRQLENRSTMTIKNGSVVNGAVATSSNAKNPGTTIVDNATYAVTGEFSGSDLGIGKLILKNGATASVEKISKDKATVYMAAGTTLTCGTTDLAIETDEGYEIVYNAGVYTTRKTVAQIGETKYETLQAAVNAAASGDVIKILVDIEATVKPTADPVNNANSSYVQIAKDKSVTIDLNGKTISVTGDSEALYDTIGILNYGDLTINDTVGGGKLTFAYNGTMETGTSQIHSTILNFGTLTITGGTIENKSTTGYGRYTINNYSWGGNANVTINGGYISNDTSVAVYADGYSDFGTYTCNVTVTNGTIAGGLWYNGRTPTEGKNITVSGGKFIAGTYGALTIKNIPNTAVVSGGTFQGAVSIPAGVKAISGGAFSEAVPADNCALGYLPAENADGTYGVMVDPAYGKVAMIGDTYYETVSDALNAVENGQTITLLEGISGKESGEIEFTKDIEFTITGVAPNYALPVVTFQNATVNIKDAEILIPELDARQNATINVIDSIVHDAGGNSIAKSYYNGAINISGNSVVHMMQVTTMGYITVSDNAVLNATWQTNVYGNGMIIIKDAAAVNTAAMHLTGKDYSGRDNTDADRVGKPATIVVDGASLVVGKVISNNGSDYSYNSKEGINIGTVDGKTAVLDIKNGANVNIYMANGETAKIGAGGTVNVDASTFTVSCRTADGKATLANNGTVNVYGNVTIVAPEMTGNAINGHNATLVDSNIGVAYNLYGTENKITGNTTIKGITSLGYGYTTTEKVALNITGNFNGTNVLVRTGSGYDHELTVGDANGERTTVYFGQLGTFGDAHITNTDVTYGYAFIRNDLTLTNSSMTISGVNTYIAGNAKVVLDNSTWKMPGYANIGSYGGYMYGNADVTLKNGSAITATNLGIEVDGDNIVKVTLEDNSNLTATKLTNTGSIVLNSVDATVTANECGNVISGLTDYKIGYVDGGYKLIAKVYVAEIVGGQKFESLAEAYAAAQDGDTIKLISGENVISMAGSVVGGKTVTITGTAIVDWTKGNLMIGRGGEGDGKVIFDGANITSSVKKTVASTGIHVSGSKGSDNTTNNGVLVIKNSNIELDYLINRNETIVEGNSNLTVYGGCWTHGRDASESVSGTDETATLTIESGSTVTVVNENGMGVGGEGLGVMNVKGTYHANVLNVSAKGTVNVEGGNLTIDGTATNNGTINVNEGVSTLNIATLTGSSIDLNEGAIVKDSTVGGAAYVAGNVTFRGDNIFTMITDYGDYYSSTTPSMWTVEKGASLTLTKYDRYGLGYGDQVTIYGELTDALTARENLTDADADVNMYGGLVGMTNSMAPDAQNKLTIQDAYVIFGVKGDKSFGNKAGNYYSNYEFVIDNSVITANGFKFYEDLGSSVLTMNKSDLLVNGVFMTNDASSKFTFTDSVIVSKATSNGSDDKNQNAGELILVNSSLTYNAPFTNIGTLTLGAGSSLTAPSISGTGTITIDATNLAAGAIPVVGNATGFTGTVVVTGNDALEAELTEQGIKLVGKPIALVDDNNNIISYHSSLTEAAYAVAEGGTIKLLKNVVINKNTRTKNGDWYDGLYYVGDKSFTIDLGGFTVTHDGSVNDYLLNFKNDGSKANVITLKNGTLDAGTKAFCALCTSSTSTQQITINLENINLINNISDGSVAKIRGGAVLNVNAGTVITGKDSYLGIECVASTVNIYDGAKIYMNGTSSYNGCLVGACGNGTVNVYGGYGKGVSGGFIAMTSGGTINVYGGEWIANTNGAYANSNKSVLVAQSDKQYNAGAGNSVINVTGGIFKGGYNCYGNAVGDAQIIIKGGNFNADPTAYIVEDHKVIENADGTFDVKQMVHLIINVGGSGISTMALRQDERDAATMDEAVAIAQATDAEKVTYKISGEVELTTGGSHDILNLGKDVTIVGVTPDAKLTIVGGGVPDIKGVTFKNLTLADEGTYNSHVNEFMYQNYIDCTFVEVKFVDGIRLSGVSTLTDCTVEANTTNEYAIWLDEGEFTMTGSTVTGGNDAYGLIKSDEVDKITITNNTFQYLGNANKEALNVKGASIKAENNTFIDCDKGILPADKTNYAEDGTTVLNDSAVVGNNKVITNVAEVNGQKFETLDAAYAAAQNGGEVKILRAGTYKVPSGKNITITGMVDGIVFVNIGKHNMGGASVTFNNVTFVYYPNVNYTGLQHSGNLVYNNCTINGQVFLYGQSETFNNCTFNQNSADAYNVWTYSAKEVDFNNCTFNSAGKSVLVYAESAGITNAISVTNSTFNASAAVDGKAAIEIDTSLTAGATITIDAATTATGFGNGNVSGNSLWNNKKGNNTDANNDVTVKVGDQTVLAPVTFVAKIGEIGYTDLTAALKALKSGDELVLHQDITITENWDARYTGGKITVPVTINGNGHTIKFTNTINDSNNFAAFRFEADATVKNLTMDMSEAVGTNNRFRAISAKANLTVDNCHFIGNASVSNTRAIIFGEGAGDNIGNVTVSVTNSTFKDWRRGLTDNENGQNAKAVTATGNSFENAGVNISASESIVFTDNDVSGKEVIITSNNGYTESVTVSGNNLTNGATGKVQKAASYDNIQDEFNIVATASVVSDGTVKYFNTLQAAIDAAQDGDVVNLLANSSEDVTVVQTPDKDIVIDGNGNTYSGTITIHGNARHDGAETLTIQNVKFETSEAGHYFIDSNSTGSVERYAHNVTVKDSSFTATGAAEHTAAAMRIRQGFNISMENVEATGMHSMLQAYGNTGVTISGLNATNMKNGISAGTSTGVVVDNVKIEASGYGVRADGSGAYDLTVKNSIVNAELPVVIRKNTASGYELTMEGNTLTASNEKNAGVVITTGEDGTYEAPEVGVKLNVSSTEKIFPAYTAKIGDLSYATLADAVAAANAGDEIVMLAPAVVAAGETLELNKDVTITYTSNVSGEDMITNRGNLVIDGATLVYTNTDTTASNVTVSTISCEPGSTLTVNSGVVKNDSANNSAKGIYAYAIDLLTNGGLGDVTATINGGEIISTNYMGIRQFVNGDACKNVLNVNGGTIKGATRGINIQLKNNMAYTTITGGVIEGGDYSLCFLTTSENLSVTGGEFKGSVWYSGTDGFISGGTFDERFADAYCAEGYVTVKNSDGTFGVKVGEYTVQNTDTGFGYETLADALAAVQNGDNTIVLLKDNAENVIVKQTEGVNIVIDGDNHTYSGTITIHGNARYNGDETLTIQNVDFVTNKADHYFIDSNSTASAERYAHNVTVKDSHFTATGAGRNTAAAMRIRQGFDISIENVTASNMHSLFQGYGCTGLSVKDVTVSGKNGISAGTSTNVVIDNATITATGYGIRADGSGAYDMTVKNSTIKAADPIVVRKNTADGYKLTVEGNNTLSGNANGYQVIFTAGDNGTYEAPAHTAVLSGTDSLNVFPEYQAKIGDTYFTSLAAAVAAAQAGETVVVLNDIELAEPITVAAGQTVTIDLNGKAITGTDNTSKNFGLFQNNGNLTINDSVGSGKIVVNATINSGWNRYSAVISNNPGGTLVVNGGTIEHLGGTDMAYGIDSLTNGGIGDVSVTINGGNIKSTYRGIRQFLNSDTKQNVLIINGGTVEGTNNGVFFHDPSTKANNGTITIGENAKVSGVYLFVTEGSTEWPVEVSIAKAAVTGEVTYKNVPTGYEVVEKNGIIGVESGVAKIGDTFYNTLAEAIATAQNGQTITLLKNCDEDVTVVQAPDKVITIDGNGKTMTGSITVDGKSETYMTAGLTIKNVNFVQDTEKQVFINLGADGNNNTRYACNVTVENCTFTGTGKTACGIKSYTGGSKNLTVTGCTATGMHSMLQSAGIAGVKISDVTINNSKNGLSFTYASDDVEIVNANISTDGYGIRADGTGAYDLTVKNSTVDAELPVVIRKNTASGYELTMEGNTLSVNDKGYQVIFTADDDGTYVDPTVETVLNGTESLNVFPAYQAKIDNVYYPTLAAAIAAAEDGKTVTMLTVVTMDLTIDKAIDLDTNGNTFTGAIVLANADATVIGPETMTVTTNIADHKVIYDGTKHMIDAKDYVAEVNGVKYEKLSEAIANASAGATVTLLADVTENVTIDKNLTIDGADKTLTGTITITGAVTTTIQNLNVVGGIVKDKTASNITIIGCDFDGQGYNGYALNLRTSGRNIVIEDCTAKNYTSYGFLQIPNNNNALTVKNVSIDNVIAGFRIAASNTVTMENVTITNATYGIWDNGAGSRKYTLTNCDISATNPIYVSDSATTVQTFNFKGANALPNLAESAHAKLVLNADATLTAPAGLTVTTNLGENYKVVYENGTYKVVGKVYVAEVNGVKYEKLSEAIAAASAGAKVTLLADVAEDVTVNKKLTIDGTGKIYTGKMTLKADTIIKNVNFDGKGYNGYAVETRGAQYLTIEDCTAKNYGYGFVQLVSATALTTVKNVTVSDVNYGVKVNYSSAVVLENVDITAGVAAVQNSNFGTKTITIKDSNLSILGTWKRNDTVKTAYVFEGANSVDQFDIESALDNFVLGAADATLTAPAGLTVTTNVADHEVVYENGVYSVKELPDVAQINGVGYKSIQAAIDAAVDGDTITIVADHALSSTPVIESTFGYTTLVLIEGKSVTIDFAGHTVTAVTGSADLYTAEIADTLISVIFAGKGASLTLKDSVGNGGIYVKHNADGGKVYSMIYNSASNLVIENGTYTVEETITAGSLIYADLTHTTAVKGGQFTLGNASADASSTKPWIINTEGKNKSFVEVTGGTFNQDILMNYGTAKDCEVQIPRTLVLKNNGDGTWSIENAVCYNSTTDRGYATLTEAVAAVQEGETIVLLKDNAENIELTKSIALDVNGCNYTGTVTLTAADVTLTAVEGLNVITNIADHKVVYEGGVHKVVEKVYVAEINGEKYESIQEAVEAVEAGATATITVIADHELVWDGETKIDGKYAAMAVDAGKTIILDLNGKKLTADTDKMGGTTLFAVFAADEGGNLTVTGNGTVEVTGAAAAYCLMMAFESGTKLTIENGTYYLKNASDSLIYSGGDECVIINGGNFTLGNVGTGENGKPWIFNVYGQNAGAVIVNGGTFNADVSHQFWANEVYVPETLAVKDNGDGTWTVDPAAAYIMETATSTGSRERKVGYATLAEAIAAVKTGKTVTLLADNAEDIELTKSITLDLNRMYMTGEITLASADAELTSAKDLNVITTIADAEVVYENGIYMVKMFEYVAQIGETKYDDLSDALAIAQSGETVKVLANTSEELVLVPAGVTLNLNGNVVTADNVLAFGIVQDTAAEVGGIKISGETTEAFVKLQPENGGYLPIYDTEDEGGMYKFFKYELVNVASRAAGTDTVKFGFRILFTNANGYEVLANTKKSNVTLSTKIAWTGSGKNLDIMFTFQSVELGNYGTSAAQQLANNGEIKAALTLTLSGLDYLSAGNTVSAAPVISTVAEVTCENEAIVHTIS